MAQTKQGAFEEKYPHIDAPTKQRDVDWLEKRVRELWIPNSMSPKRIYQNSLIAFLSQNLWAPRRKLDGENIRIRWDGEQAFWNGKTNNFVCSADFQDYMNNTFLEEIFEEKFGRDKVVLLFGEHMGPKVQGNELGLTKDEVVLFDVKVGNFWLDDNNVREIADYFGVKHWSAYSRPLKDNTLISLIQETAEGAFRDWEGIVATPTVDVFDRNGHRVIVKIKNKDYLR